MTYSAFDTSASNGAEAHTGPVTCESCGCRLQPATEGRDGWLHFAPMAGRDARGCRIACADAVHDRHGRTTSA